jgi:hypothetical protein
VGGEVNLAWKGAWRELARGTKNNTMTRERGAAAYEPGSFWAEERLRGERGREAAKGAWRVVEGGGAVRGGARSVAREALRSAGATYLLCAHLRGKKRVDGRVSKGGARGSACSGEVSTPKGERGEG